MAAHEGLAAGLIGVAGALFAAWVAWSGIQNQIFEEEQRRLRQMADEEQRQARQEAEAKIAAQMCIGPPLNAAAAALAAINNALAAPPDQEADRDRLVQLMARHTQSALNSFTVRESLRDLALQDRLYFLAIVATLNGFVDVSLRPSPALNRSRNLESWRATLMSLHHHLEAFDPHLAANFARDSQTRATDAPPISNTVRVPRRPPGPAADC